MDIFTEDTILKLKEKGVLPIGPGEAHLQDEILDYKCFFCGKPEDNNMALIRKGDKKLVFSCVDHPGIVQEYIRLYGRPPLGYIHTR